MHRHSILDEIESVTPSWGQRWRETPGPVRPLDDAPPIAIPGNLKSHNRGEGREKMRAALATGWFNTRELADRCGMEARTVSAILWQMQRDGLVKSREKEGIAYNTRRGNGYEWTATKGGKK